MVFTAYVLPSLTLFKLKAKPARDIPHSPSFAARDILVNFEISLAVFIPRNRSLWDVLRERLETNCVAGG